MVSAGSNEFAELRDRCDTVMTRNSTTVWGWPAILLHWIGAVLVLVLLVHGAWMVHFAPRPERAVNYAWHAAIGYDFLALLVLRLLWRWMKSGPGAAGRSQALGALRRQYRATSDFTS